MRFKRFHTSLSHFVFLVLFGTCLRLLYVQVTYRFPFYDVALLTPISYPAFFTLLTMTDVDKTKAVYRSWLAQSDYSLLFTRHTRLSNEYRFVSFKYNERHPWPMLRAETVFLARFVPVSADWFIFTFDDTFLVIDSIKYVLELFDPSKRYLAVLGRKDLKKDGECKNEECPRVAEKSESAEVHILSRAAFQHMQTRIEHGTDGCSLTLGSIRECLEDTVEIDLSHDVQGKQRSPILNRHLMTGEMESYTSDHQTYNDGRQIWSWVSRDLLSLHGLSAEDIRVFDVLFNRVQRIANHFSTYRL